MYKYYELVEVNKKTKCPICGMELIPPIFSGVFTVDKIDNTYRCASCDKTFEKRCTNLGKTFETLVIEYEIKVKENV